jgi:hypothetical protein
MLIHTRIQAQRDVCKDVCHSQNTYNDHYNTSAIVCTKNLHAYMCEPPANVGIELCLQRLYQESRVRVLKRSEFRASQYLFFFFQVQLTQ